MRKKLVKGVGIIGDGPYKSRENDKHTKEYNTWFDMISRCYDEKYRYKRPTYQGCSVAESWHHFQNFAEWYTNHRNYGKSGYQLDKDLMFSGNMLYSPETCDLVPSQINSLVIVPSVSKNSRYVGVHWCTRDKRFIAQIRIDGVRVKLGYFVNEEDAYEEYISAKSSNLRRMAELYKSEIHPLIYENLKNWK